MNSKRCRLIAPGWIFSLRLVLIWQFSRNGNTSLQEMFHRAEPNQIVGKGLFINDVGNWKEEGVKNLSNCRKIKPNYFKKQPLFIIIFTYLRYYTGPKWPWNKPSQYSIVILDLYNICSVKEDTKCSGVLQGYYKVFRHLKCAICGWLFHVREPLRVPNPSTALLFAVSALELYNTYQGMKCYHVKH